MTRSRVAGATIGVIGIGNMGSALAKGWLRAGDGSSPAVLVWDKIDASVQRLVQEFGSRSSDPGPALGRLFAAGSLKELVAKADVLVVVVKPKDARGVLADLGRQVREEQVVVSAMAGLTLEWLRGVLGPGPALFRIMPNLAVEVGAGAVALASEPGVSSDAIEAMLSLFQPLGSVEVVAEELFDVVTAVSGSGPAFLAVAIEALEDGAVTAGLTRGEARTVVRRAALTTAAALPDAAEPAKESRRGPGREGEVDPVIDRLLEEREVRATFRRAAQAAMDRSRQMQRG